MAVHFVNFRDEDRFQNAMRVFGEPDFVHLRWDARARFGGEFDTENDGKQDWLPDRDGAIRFIRVPQGMTSEMA